jgi:hypothetical protein
MASGTVAGPAAADDANPEAASKAAIPSAAAAERHFDDNVGLEVDSMVVAPPKRKRDAKRRTNSVSFGVSHPVVFGRCSAAGDT